MNNYDVILVGAGIANIALALKLADTNKQVLILELGPDIKNRMCPKAKTGKCVNCSPCRITTGFGGAGFFSDCKLTYSPEIGGNVVDYIGKDNFDKYLDEADKLFTEFGARQEYSYNEDFANSLAYECSKYNMKLLKGKVRHLGTDGSYDVMCNIYDKLNNASNITILCNTEVIDLNATSKRVSYITKSDLNSLTTAYGKDISVAVGRFGSDWLRKQCEFNNIKLENSTVDIGVRVECPRAVTDKITDKLYEFKIVNYSSSDNRVRTFCVNPGGISVRENYDDVVCVNGHSYSDNKSLTTNFALLVSCNFTEPFNEPIRYGKYVCSLSNMLANGKPMVQRLADLKAKKRSTKDRIKRLPYTPTLEEAEPGDLRYVFPANVIDSIVETLENLDNVMPGINGNGTILYSPEVKFYSSKIKVDDNLQSNGIYFLGDSSGVTHGIMQSALSGLFVADRIIGE